MSARISRFEGSMSRRSLRNLEEESKDVCRASR